MLAAFSSILCPDDPTVYDGAWFSFQVCFDCISSVFGIIVKLINWAIAFRMVLHSGLKSDGTHLHL